MVKAVAFTYFSFHFIILTACSDFQKQADKSNRKHDEVTSIDSSTIATSKFQILAKGPTRIWSIQVINRTNGRLVVSGGPDFGDPGTRNSNEGFIGTSTDWGKTIKYQFPRATNWDSDTGWLSKVACLNDNECWTAGRWCGVFYTSDFGESWTRALLDNPYCQNSGGYTYAVVARNGMVMVTGTPANVFRLKDGSKTEFWMAKSEKINYAMFNLNCQSDEFCYSASVNSFMTMPLRSSYTDGRDMTRDDFRGGYKCEGDKPASYMKADYMIVDWDVEPKPAEDYCSIKQATEEAKCSDANPPDSDLCHTLEAKIDDSFYHGHPIWDFTFVNDLVGFAINQDGTIGKTEDKGANFSVVKRTKRQLYGISMASEKVGYIAAEKGTLLKTINGGATWEPDPEWPPELNQADITAVHFIDESKGYVGMKDGTLVYWGPP